MADPIHVSNELVFPFVLRVRPRHVSQAQERPPAAGAATPAREPVGRGPAQEELEPPQDTAQDEAGVRQAGQVAGALDSRQLQPEEGAALLDGPAGRVQDGPPRPHLPVLHPHGHHFSTGKTSTRDCWEKKRIRALYSVSRLKI